MCVNDDMKKPTPEMVAFLQDFYVSFFPKPSQFELPAGTTNPPGLGPTELARRAAIHSAVRLLAGLALLAAAWRWALPRLVAPPAREDAAQAVAWLAGMGGEEKAD